MPKTNRKNINDTPIWFRGFFVLLPILGFFLIHTNLNNDFYFLYPTGEYILKNGIPHQDFLSMHSGMNIVVQQWLTCVLFYAIYSETGIIGIIGTVYICYALLCFLVFNLIKTICHNAFVASIFACFIDILMAAMFMTTRPQIFTFLILTSEVLILERVVQNKNYKWFIALPLLSVLLVNIHSSMWPFIFVFAAPYAVSAIPFKFDKLKHVPSCSFIKVLITGAICFACGSINPYGIKAATYAFSSIGSKELSSISYEMSSFSFNDDTSIMFLSFLAILLVAFLFVKKKAFELRFVLMFFGTVLLACINIRSISYFLIFGVASFSYFFKNQEITILVPQKTDSSKSSKKRIALLTGAFVLALCVGGVVMTNIFQNTHYEALPKQEAKSSFDILDNMAEIMNNRGENVVLYTDMDWGPYMEYRGFHPYIDDRMELFLKSNNGEYDYLKEYIQLTNLKIDYKDFVIRYQINYLIVSERSPILKKALENDNDFEILYKENELSLLHLKHQLNSKS